MKQQLLFTAKLFALAGGYLFTRSRTESVEYRSREKSLPDFAVMFLLVNLKRFVLVNWRLIRGAKNQIEMLENDVSLFKAFLMDLDKRRYKNDDLLELENQIRDVIYDGEDIIDAFMILTADGRRRSLFDKCFGGPRKIVNLAREIHLVRVRVKCTLDRSKVVFAALKNAPREQPKIKAEKIPPSICYKEETKPETKDFSVKESKEVDVIAKNDMPGYGKTWQKKAFSLVQESDADLPLAIGYVYFKNPICVSRHSELVNNIGSIMSGMYQMPDQDVMKRTNAPCKGRKYVFVMDRVNPAC